MNRTKAVMTWRAICGSDTAMAMLPPTGRMLEAFASRIEADALKGAAGIEAALDIARRYGGIDGDHHNAWVIDQMCRALLGDGYAAFMADAKDGEDGPETYSWDEGIAP